MDSVWLKRGLFALLVLVIVGSLWLLLVPDRQTEHQMQSGMEQPAPQSQDQTPQQPAQTPATPQTAPEPEPEKHMYEMGIWEGKVAVFLPDTDVPMRITEMPVTSLPQADQQALRERIPVYDAEALASYLEDFGS